MSIDDQQIRALAFLAKSCRPTGARRWDEAGIVAAIAQVRSRSLPEVAMAVIRAASDRDCQTPGVIPSNGSHWAESVSVRPAVVESAPVGTRCTVCGNPKPPSVGADHYYSPPREVDVETYHAKVQALRAELAPTSGPTERRSLEDLADANPDLHARVETVRAAISKEDE